MAPRRGLMKLRTPALKRERNTQDLDVVLNNAIFSEESDEMVMPPAEIRSARAASHPTLEATQGKI